MGPRIDDIVGKTHKKYISFLPSHKICILYQRLNQNGHFVGKFPSLDAAIIHPQAWRRETPGMLPSPLGDTAIITSHQLIDNDHQLRYQDLCTPRRTYTADRHRPRSRRLFPRLFTALLLVFASLTTHLDYTLVHPLPVRVIKPSLTITAWV